MAARPSGMRGRSVSGFVSARYLRATKRPDPSRGWRVTGSGAADTIRVALFGDCAFREMPHAHTPFTPPGYPRALAELLAQRGKEMVFSWRFVPRGDELPATREELRAAVKFEGPPDVVLVQVGAICAFPLYALPTSPVAMRVRDQIGSALGTRVRLGYRSLPRWWIRRFGRPALPPQDPERVEAFVDLVREEWPETRVVILSTFHPGPGTIVREGTLDRVSEELREVAERRGVAFLDLRPATAGLADGDRCANGYNLAPAGHEAVARVIDRHLREAEAAVASEPSQAR